MAPPPICRSWSPISVFRAARLDQQEVNAFVTQKKRAWSRPEYSDSERSLHDRRDIIGLSFGVLFVVFLAASSGEGHAFHASSLRAPTTYAASPSPPHGPLPSLLPRLCTARIPGSYPADNPLRIQLLPSFCRPSIPSASLLACICVLGFPRVQASCMTKTQTQTNIYSFRNSASRGAEHTEPTQLHRYTSKWLSCLKSKQQQIVQQGASPRPAINVWTAGAPFCLSVRETIRRTQNSRFVRQEIIGESYGQTNLVSLFTSPQTRCGSHFAEFSHARHHKIRNSGSKIQTYNANFVVDNVLSIL